MLSCSFSHYDSSDEVASLASGDLDELSFDDNSDTPSVGSELDECSFDNTTTYPDASPSTSIDPGASVPLQSCSDDDSELQKIEMNSLNSGYKIVFDNIDKNVKPRFVRSDHQTHSLHFVHSYAVKDRIEFSQFSSKTPTAVNIFDIIPDEHDYKSLKSDFAVLISRMIVEYMPFFSTDYKGIPLQHIPHKYSKQMSIKSEVVSHIFVSYIIIINCLAHLLCLFWA